MIKLTNILNELSINNPLVTAEKVHQYFRNNIIRNDVEFELDSEGWKEYKQIYQLYLEKYDISDWIGLGNFEDLSQQDLNKLYNEMRKLVKKYVGKEVLNELEINNPRITVEKTKQYYQYNIVDQDMGIWEEYLQICEPYCKKYGIDGWIGLYDFEKLSQQDLNKFYNEMIKLTNNE